MIFSWAACTVSIVVSNFSCLALSSFFFSILPTKRNLLTYFDTVLVLCVTAAVNIGVGGVIILGILKLLQKIRKTGHVITAESKDEILSKYTILFSYGQLIKSSNMNHMYCTIDFWGQIGRASCRERV